MFGTRGPVGISAGTPTGAGKRGVFVALVDRAQL